jgi:hypothetical protein
LPPSLMPAPDSIYDVVLDVPINFASKICY